MRDDPKSNGNGDSGDSGDDKDSSTTEEVTE